MNPAYQEQSQTADRPTPVYGIPVFVESNANTPPKEEQAPTKGPHSFRKFAQACAESMGHPGTFGLAVVIVLAWGISGPLFHFSDTWQLVINTGTTIVTFLMVFLIQHTQNRDTAAVQLKLDELIRAVQGARNEFIRAEEFEDGHVMAAQEEFREVAKDIAEIQEKLEKS